MDAFFDQELYIESTRAMIKEYLRGLFPDVSMPVALPDIGNDELFLEEPVVHIEYSRSFNTDPNSGKNNGRGQRVKRKRLTYNIQILTTGENSAVLARDRIAQKIETEFAKESTSQEFARNGMFKLECRHMNSYRVREGLHLCRLEVFSEIKIKS